MLYAIISRAVTVKQSDKQDSCECERRSRFSGELLSTHQLG